MQRAFVAAGVFAAAFLVSCTAARAADQGRPTTFDARGAQAGATVKLRVVDADGHRSALFGPFTAGPDGRLSGTVPTSITRDARVSADDFYRGTVDLQTAEGKRVGAVNVSAAPGDVVLEADFVSSKGWVKPGETYPFTVRVLNYGETKLTGAQVTLTPPDGATLSTTTWDVPTVDAKGPDGTPGMAVKVVEATADTLAQDPQIVWKNLSTTATLGTLTDTTRGPKVIPPTGGFETARYGDRPFPVVPVDYRDRKHALASTATKLANKINDPANAGSTFNLYQEISYRQLFPHATVPTEAITTAPWTADDYPFTTPQTQCALNSNVTTGYKTGNRISNGWYQLPGDTTYYGQDGKGSALIGALTGVGALQDIDSGCGPTGKAVFDAAAIADPEIDYDRYDTDKDGVVDFFMMVFPGEGGNGASQTSGLYDNIWPHSSDLQNSYTDANGEKGYVTRDQSHDLEGRPLFWTDASRSAKTTNDTGIPVHTRVGPYNVNPETAITFASVISHEYGHSLGLPDYYSTGSRETYGGWTLMATDLSQNIDVIGKKELGWLVPRVLEPGERTVTNWRDSKRDTGRIDWKAPDGTPYTLTGAGIHNGEAYVANLPGRRVIDPALVPSGTHLYWSGSGNAFDCPPAAGHNLDLAIPAVPAGTQKLTLTFKSRWDIEWDFDYGFVVGSTDSGKTYTSFPSAKGYTTPASQNPNANGCQQTYGNGLTGSSGSYAANTQTVDRVAGNYPTAGFVDDEYDISALKGTAGAVLRFAYSTDPGMARPGWFIDDIVIKADDKVIYSSDLENASDPALYNGGCRESLQTAQRCTPGWTYVAADQNSPAEHAYLMELRDRSGFDLEGWGESERDPIAWRPGVLLAFTDEDHGYGNVGTDDPPAQTPLDARPEPGSDTPNLDDAAFKQGDSFSDGGAGHTDNYLGADGGNWVLDAGCLSFTVNRLSGDGDGPEVLQGDNYDLSADVAFATSMKCGQFDYGNGHESDGVPVGDAPVPPTQEQRAGTAQPSGGGPVTTTAVPVRKAAQACKARGVKARGPLRSFRTACPSFGAGKLTVTFRLKQGARVRVDLLRGSKLVKRVLELRTRRAARTYTLKIAPKGLKPGRYTLRLRATRAHRTTTLKLPVIRS